MNEKTAYKKHWHVFVSKKFPVIDDKSHDIVSKGEKLKVRKFQALSLSEKRY